MTQKTDPWVKALHPNISDGTTINPPRATMLVSGAGKPAIVDHPDTDTVELDYSSSAGSSTPGVITIEQFAPSGVNPGDGIVNAQPYFAAALAAMAAAVVIGSGPQTLELGSNRTYLVTGGTLPAGCAIIGQGNSSILKTTTNAPVVVVGGDYTDLLNFHITGNNTGANQVGIQNGQSGSSGSGFSIAVRIHNVIVESCPTGIEMNEYGAATHRGPIITACTVIAAKGNSTGKGGIWLGNLAEYTIVNACRVTASEIGIVLGAGNLNISACMVNDSSVTGIWQRGDLGNTWQNDGHGIVQGCTVNHATGDALKVDAIVNGMIYANNSFQGGTVTLTGSLGVQLKGNIFDVTDFFFDGSRGTVIGGSMFIPNVTPNVHNNYNGHVSTTRWTPDNYNTDGTVPAWIYAGDDGSGFAHPIFGVLQLPRQPNDSALSTDPAGNVGKPLTSPLDLPGIQLWLRADTGVTVVSSHVSEWDDQSGNGDTNRNHTQATSGNRPGFNASDSNYNNQPTVGPFTGSATLLASGVWSSPPPETGFMAFVCDIPNTGAGTIIDSLSAQRYTIYRNGADLGGSFSNNGNFGAAPEIAARPCIIIIEMNGAETKAWVNGLLFVGVHDLGSSSPTGTTIGNAQAPGTVPTNGSCAEVVIGNQILTAGQRERLQLYFSQRYAVALAAQ